MGGKVLLTGLKKGTEEHRNESEWSEQTVGKLRKGSAGSTW